MDYQAIIEALDARTLEAFKAWGETFAAGMKAALDERDARISALEEKLSANAAAHLVTDEVVSGLAEQIAGTQKQVRETLAAIPVPTYKGVFDRDAAYKAGDMVTHKGSVWHCNAATDGETPGASEAWTLAVKCGRDGRDAKPEATE